VPLIVELPLALAGATAVLTFTTPLGVMQLTVALKNGTGLGGVCPAMINPLTVTLTLPCRSTSP
jgi:hypothetical protein